MSINKHDGPSAKMDEETTAESPSKTPTILDRLQKEVGGLRSRRGDFADQWPEIAYKIDCLCQKEELLDKMNELLLSQTREMEDECQSLKEEINECMQEAGRTHKSGREVYLGSNNVKSGDDNKGARMEE